MRLLNVTFFLLFSVQFSFGQGTLKLDASTMTLNDKDVKFKSGKMISFKVINFTDQDSFVLEISFDNVFNDAGLKKFSSVGGITKDGVNPTVQNPYYFLSFKVEDKDYSKLKLTRYLKGKKKGEAQLIESRTYTFRNSGGIKFDISTGFFSSSVRDSIYVLKYETDTSRQIIPESIGTMKVGLGVLAHLHTRFNYPINLGVSVGFEIESDAALSYLAGLSLFFGNDQKIVLNGGIALSQVDVLSQVYAENKIVSNQVLAIPTTEIWRGGWFLGVSYNF